MGLVALLLSMVRVFGVFCVLGVRLLSVVPLLVIGVFW